jgi:DNA uptake protein ComE-like DNA-binding protein
MPTPAERKALLFLASIIVLGASVRVVRAARGGGATDAANSQALARQIAAVDSARGPDARSRRPPRSSGRPVDRRITQRRARARSPADSGARSDSAERWVREPLSVVAGESNAVGADRRGGPAAIVDLDIASESEIESLPRIGGVLARRIVSDRSANGPFGSLEGFQRVRGVGPGLVALLQGRVTFSGTGRPSDAVVHPRLRSSSPPSTSSRRERRP